MVINHVVLLKEYSFTGDIKRVLWSRCWTIGDWCLAQWLILSTSVVRKWGQIPLGQFLVAELNIQYPVKSIAPYLGGRRGWVPSDSLRKFLQEVNLYKSFKHFFRCWTIVRMENRERMNDVQETPTRLVGVAILDIMQFKSCVIDT